jgi:hypothetical protein
MEKYDDLIFLSRTDPTSSVHLRAKKLSHDTKYITCKYLQWNFSNPDPDFLSPCRTILCKGSLTKLANPLNRPYILVPVLASLEKFHCTFDCVLSTDVWIIIYWCIVLASSLEALWEKQRQCWWALDRIIPILYRGLQFGWKCCMYKTTQDTYQIWKVMEWQMYRNRG